MLLIFSCGRSGTNLVLEMFTGTDQFIPSINPEDKLLFKRNVIYPYKYLTKCDTVYLDNYNQFKQFMKLNPHCNILWTVRNPYDWAMSKIYRGWGHADDATFHGCLADMYYMYSIYHNVVQDFPNNVMVVRMEDVIEDIEKTARDICNKFGYIYEDNMKIPHLRMRHEGKKNRYPTLDNSQIGLYKNYLYIYDKFFRDKEVMLLELFMLMRTLVIDFGYEIEF